MLKLRLLTYTLIVALMLFGCTANSEMDEEDSHSRQDESSSEKTDLSSRAVVVTSDSESVKSEDLDASWEEKKATKIIFNDDNIEINGSGASANGSVVTISSAGTYVATGKLIDGQIAINASEKALVRLVLDGVDISNSATSPIYCEQADKFIIILADGSTNTIADSENYVFPNSETDEPNAAIFSKTDLTINGTGTLTVNAKYSNGIGTKDDLIIVSGMLDVTAPNDAVRGRDSVTVLDAGLILNAGGDGIQANNDTEEDKGWVELHGGTFDITAAYDGIQAETWLKVTGGSFHIITGGGSANAPERATDVRGGPGGGGMMNQVPGQPGGEGQRPQRQQPDVGVQIQSEVSANADDMVSGSFKGIKAGTNIEITGGTFVIDSADDALHANGNVSVSGGKLTVSTGDDGIHADGNLAIDGNPTIDVLTSYEGIEGAVVTVSGGNISILASDDGINVAGGAEGSEGGMFGQDRFNSASGDYWIRVEGGSIDITAGTDGIDSNGDIYVSGGEITFSMTNLNAIGGDGMIDKDGDLEITGGRILGTGGNGIVTMGRGSASGFSTQAVLQLYYTNTQTAGSLVELKTESNSVVVSFTPKRDFSCIIVSLPELNSGESYSVYTGNTKTLDFTPSDAITSLQDTASGDGITTREVR